MARTIVFIGPRNIGGPMAANLVKFGAEAAQVYALFAGAGHADEDFSGIINFVRGLGAA